MKCPMTFNNTDERGAWSDCDPDCAWRISRIEENEDGVGEVVGYSCAVAIPAAFYPFDGISLCAPIESEDKCK